MDTDWMEVGKCKDLSPSIFFPSDGVGVQEAQRICAECPVADACLEYALAGGFIRRPRSHIRIR